VYLKYSNLASRDGKRHCHTLAVDTEAVTFSRCSQVEATDIGDVCVAVHHRTLDVTELGRCPLKKQITLNELLSRKERLFEINRHPNKV